MFFLKEENMFEFTKKQDLAVKAMLKGQNVFITGPAGTGKSFIIFYFLSKLQLMGVDKDEIAV